MDSPPRKTLIVSTSSDDLLSPSPNSSSDLRNSLSNMELNSNSKDNYYNFCAPKLPAHSSQARSLRNNLTLSDHKLPHSNDALCDSSPDDSGTSKLSAVSNGMDLASEPNIVTPVYLCM